MDKNVAIRSMLLSTTGAVGEAFLRDMVRQIGDLFNADDVLIAFALDDPATRVRIRNYWSSSGDDENFDYDLSGTPCQLVYGGKPTLIPCDVNKNFPEEIDTEDRSFIGVPMFQTKPISAADKVVGHLAIYAESEIDDDPDLLDVATIFANRAQVEIERLQAGRRQKLFIEELQQAREKAERLNEQKTQYLGVAAHEIRNGVQITKSNAYMLRHMKSKLSSAKRDEILESIIAAADAMDALVDDYLDSAIQELGEVPFSAAPTDLAQLARDRVEIATVFADQKEMSIETSIPADLPNMNIDRGKISQALDNLVGNAIKYSSTGSLIRVELSASDGTVTLAVIDQGPGVPEDELETLFTPLVTTANEPTGNEKSTGLGLAIVKSIVDKHDGTAKAWNNEGGGATFAITLPIG